MYVVPKGQGPGGWEGVGACDHMGGAKIVRKCVKTAQKWPKAG
jgi:hypothetical protein